MREELSSLFNSEHFKSILERYERMQEEGNSVYFESEDLTLISEFYAYKRQIDKAEEVINYALEMHPDDLDIQLYKCHNLALKDHYDEAYHILDNQPDQTDREVILVRAGLQLEQNRTEEASAAFEKLALDEGNDINTFIDIADICIDAHKKSEAIKWLRKALKKDPENIQALDSMSDYYLTFNMPFHTPDILNKLLDHDPFSISYWIKLTQCYVMMGEAEKALEAADFALAIDSKNVTAMLLKGNAFLMLDELAESTKYYEMAKELATDKVLVLENLANCYYLQRNYEQCIYYCSRLLDSPYYYELTKEEKVSLYSKRADSLLQTDDLFSCYDNIVAGMELDKNDPSLCRTMGELSLVTKKRKNAIKYFNLAIQFSEEDYKTEMIESVAITLFGYLYFEEALIYFEMIESIDSPRGKYLHFPMACCYFHTKSMSQFVSAMAKAYHYFPESFTSKNFEQLSRLEPQFYEAVMNILDKIREGIINPEKYI